MNRQIIHIATLTGFPGSRPHAVSLVVEQDGLTAVRMEQIGSYQPMLDCAVFDTPADAAETLAERHAPAVLMWDDIGTAYTTALSDGSKDGPVAWVTKHTHGFLLLDLPHVRVITWAGAAAAEQSRMVRDWLSRTLPDLPVRLRAGGGDAWEVVIGQCEAY